MGALKGRSFTDLSTVRSQKGKAGGDDSPQVRPKSTVENEEKSKGRKSRLDSARTRLEKAEKSKEEPKSGLHPPPGRRSLRGSTQRDSRASQLIAEQARSKKTAANPVTGTPVLMSKRVARARRRDDGGPMASARWDDGEREKVDGGMEGDSSWRWSG